MRRNVRIATLLVAGATILLQGCRGPLPIPTVACTEIGCENAVEFHLAQSLQEDRSYTIEACADSFCRSATVEISTGLIGQRVEGLDVGLDRILLILPEADYAGRHRVSLVLRDAETGQVQVQTEHDIDFERRQPNGPNCPPVCWFARLVA